MLIPIKRGVTFAAVVLLGLVWATAPTGALDRPSGAVVLTVGGAISESNRGPFDESVDKFFMYHEISFDKAAAFDAAMLEALGMHEVTVAYADRPEQDRFEGPRLKDVLDAAGFTGDIVRVVALDAYAEELSRAELETYDWILATKRNGEALGIGQFGPLRLVYARHDGEPITIEDETRWPWAVFYIEVR
jgi:hypothetical protein